MSRKNQKHRKEWRKAIAMGNTWDAIDRRRDRGLDLATEQVRFLERGGITALSYGGPHGMKPGWRLLHRGDASICPEGDSLYPSHEWQNVTLQPDGAEFVCSLCDLRALDVDEGGVKLVPCAHGEEPGYCDCGFTGGQKSIKENDHG